MSDPAKFGYLRLEVYHLSQDLSVRMDATSRKLPYAGKSKVADQIQRSSASVPALIVEGYARRRYKAAWLNYLDQALGSADETRQHLECLFQTGALKNWAEYSALAAACEKLSAKLGAFIKGVEKHHTLPYYLRDCQGAPQSEIGRSERASKRAALPAEPNTRPGRVPRGLRNRESRIENRILDCKLGSCQKSPSPTPAVLIPPSASTTSAR
jgi:four helix bundle protein